jgi:DNA-binding PadR family transcriptional regulator
MVYICAVQLNKQEPGVTLPLSAVDFHVLLVLARRTLHGYAILKAVETESGGAVSPEVGSLYRVLARLMAEGLVEETSAPASAPKVHRGRSRRYYRLTREGRALLKAEARRLASAVEIARNRAILPEGAL